MQLRAGGGERERNGGGVKTRLSQCRPLILRCCCSEHPERHGGTLAPSSPSYLLVGEWSGSFCFPTSFQEHHAFPDNCAESFLPTL